MGALLWKSLRHRWHTSGLEKNEQRLEEMMKWLKEEVTDLQRGMAAQLKQSAHHGQMALVDSNVQSCLAAAVASVEVGARLSK